MITASDFHTHCACPRWTYLDFHGDRRHRQSPSEFAQKLLADGRDHENNVISELKAYRVPFDGRDVQLGIDCTRRAMQRGPPRIAGAVLASANGNGKPNRFGIADLLERVPGRSLLGSYHYEPIEIKTARRVKGTYRLQLNFYAELLAELQGVWPRQGHVILGNRDRHSITIESIRPLYEQTIRKLQEISDGHEPSIHVSAQCSNCPWQRVCLPEAVRSDHISLVYGLDRRHAANLMAQGVRTCEQLAGIRAEVIEESIGCGASRAEDLHGQARAMSAKRALWRRHPYLPRASSEIFFDIEGDPDHDALYLFGVLVRSRRDEVYRSFLAEKPAQEGKAFVACLEFMERFPDAPIYHYHHYERSALERLVDQHGVSRERVDAILPRLVDLNALIHECCYLPVSSYSLKVVARYLGFEWSQEDSSAVQSVVWFSSWLKSGDRSFLNRAIQYNADDCRATRVLKDWLTAGPDRGGKPRSHARSARVLVQPR